MQIPCRRRLFCSAREINNDVVTDDRVIECCDACADRAPFYDRGVRPQDKVSEEPELHLAVVQIRIETGAVERAARPNAIDPPGVGVDTNQISVAVLYTT